MVQHLEGLRDLVEWSDEVEDGGEDVGQAKADASNVDGPEASWKVDVVFGIIGLKIIDGTQVWGRKAWTVLDHNAGVSVHIVVSIRIGPASVGLVIGTSIADVEAEVVHHSSCPN